MAQELRIKTTDTPTIFNKDMAIGAIIGNIAGGFLGGIVGGPVGSAIGRIAGIVLTGAWRGLARKAEMAQEAITGKPVKAPSHFTKDTFLGAAIGVLAGGALFSAILATAGISLSAVAGGVSVMAVAPVAAVSALAVFAGAAIAGAVIGARHGHKNMENDYRQAIEEQVQREQAQGRGQSYEYESRIARSANHARDVSSRREVAAQENYR